LAENIGDERVMIDTKACLFEEKVSILGAASYKI